MIKDAGIQELLTQFAPPGLQWAGVRVVHTQESWDVFRDEKFDYHHTGDSWGAMVEVLVHGQFAYAATPEVTDAGLRRALQSAYAQAKAAAPYGVFGFSPQVRPQARGHYVSPSLKKPGREDHKQILELLPHLCSVMNKTSDLICKTVAAVSLTHQKVRYFSSNGSAFFQEFIFGELSLSAIAQKGNVTQKRSDGGHVFQRGWDWILAADTAALAQRIAAQAVELVHAPECPTTTTHVVLAPDQMMLQIHESIGHPLELDRILGDERNYAGSSFVTLTDFGKLQYGSPLMNVTFDPQVETELASYAFDDCGNKAEKQFLIKEGVLLRGLGSLESQVRSGVPGVANQRACSWNRPPIDRMANLNLEPGAASFAEIIASIEHGIFMESNRSWSIDDYRNKFQFGCEYARLIEKGQLKGVVKNPNYRGVTTSFWNNLVAVGNEQTFGIYGTANCGKGEPNQSIRVGHASPVCAFQKIEIFGGAG